MQFARIYLYTGLTTYCEKQDIINEQFHLQYRFQQKVNI